MVRISAVSACFVFAAFCTAAASAQALTGEMAPLQYLVGTWDCSVDAMQPSGAMRHDNGTLSVAVAPGNTLSQTITSPMFSIVGLYGLQHPTQQIFFKHDGQHGRRRRIDCRPRNTRTYDLYRERHDGRTDCAEP